MSLLEVYKNHRKRFISLCLSLKVEDYMVQPELFVSPPKWHLAHTTWFFEQFVLKSYLDDYKVFNEEFCYLFNSYYKNVGEHLIRPNRGNMTRPTVDEVYQYRAYVDQEIERFLNKNPSEEAKTVIEIGLQHEQQHQELFCYDIKYILGNQALFPTIDLDLALISETASIRFVKISEGIYDVGYKDDGFCFDIELGQHKVYLHDFEIATTLVTNADYLEFINDGGYQNFNLWHAEGWDYIQQQQTKAPMYWHKKNDQWHYYTLQGLKPLELQKPVSHVNFYEAFAFAQWKQMRLPTEFEWEIANQKFHWGQLWEWTNSAFLPYPNYIKKEGAIGEYNGKFMVNQMVLRGASVATPELHSRATYRNFFHPNMRWQFCGIRLAK